MNANETPPAARADGAFRRVLHRATLAGACGLVLALQGCGDDVTPARPSPEIAGSWKVQCQPVNDDCPDFTITFAPDGDIAGADIDGGRGPQRGYGEIAGNAVTFRLGFGTTYLYSGTLDYAGNVATGALTNYDYDGEQKTTPAKLTRQ